MMTPEYISHKINTIFCLPCLMLFSITTTGQINSERAYQVNNGSMEYTTDEQNNYILDFSYAGYKNGNEAIPNIPVVKTIQPIAGDNTQHIQDAIEEVSYYPLNAQGFRGAVLLQSGVYEVDGILSLHTDGVVLRGVGDGSTDSGNTILKAVGNSPDERALIVVGTEDHEEWEDAVSGTRTDITSSFLPAGSRSLEVADLSPFEVGDQIMVFHPSTSAWLASINYGDTDSDDPWEPGQIDIYYNRYIKAIHPAENKIELDVPIYDHFDNSLAQSEIYLLDEPNIVRNAGVENLRIEIETDDDEDEDHAWTGIRFEGAEDCWANGITVLHFSYAAVYTNVASRISVLNCNALEPHSEIDGSRRYNFAVNKYSNNILFQNCTTSWGRHSYVSNGTSTASGIVFQNCQSEHDYTASEGHRRWTQAMLFDNIHFSNPEGTQLLGMYNRGSWGTSHGWGTVNSVAWNVVMEPERELILQKPPGRQNYAIGSRAEVKADYVYDHDIGYEEATGSAVGPPSLYQAQLDARLQHGSYPDAPIELEGFFENDKVMLSWTDIAADEEGYRIEYSCDGGQNYNIAGTVAKNETTYTHDDEAALAGGLFYRVAAIKGACKSPWASEIIVETSTGDCVVPVSEPESEAVSGLRIYPNPATTYVALSADFDLKSVVVLDVLGRPIEKYSNPTSLDVTTWPSAVYFLRIRDEEAHVSLYKLVKK